MAASDERQAPALAARLAPALAAVRGIRPVWQRLIVLVASRLAAFLLLTLVISLLLSGPSDSAASAQIAERLAVTLPLFFIAAILALLVGLPLGFLLALGGWFGSAFRPLAALGALVPAFWIGMMLVLLFSGVLQWLPAGGFVPWGEDVAGALLSFLLPAFALALPAGLSVAAVTAASLKTRAVTDAVQLSRRLGQPHRRALLLTGAVVALPSLLPLLGTLLAVTLGSALIIENVFYLPGLGRLLLTAALHHDVAAVRTGLIVLAALCLGIRLATDTAAHVLGGRVNGPTRPPLRRPLLLRVSMIATLVLLLLAFVSLVWTPQPVDRAQLGQQLVYPSFTHWLGTDAQGRDVLSLLMKGLLTSFVVAGIGTAIGLVVGGALGLAASRWNRWLPAVANGVSTTLSAMPAVAVAIALATLGSAGAINTMVATGLASAPAFALATLGGVQTFWRSGYVAAALQAGASSTDAWFRHVLPGLWQVLAGVLLLQMATGVATEAALSYAGVGAHEATFSLGLMLRDAQSYLTFEPLLAVAPGLALVLVTAVLGLAGWALGGDADGTH